MKPENSGKLNEDHVQAMLEYKQLLHGYSQMKYRYISFSNSTWVAVAFGSTSTSLVHAENVKW